jgi:hypothetical protein
VDVQKMPKARVLVGNLDEAKSQGGENSPPSQGT